MKTKITNLLIKKDWYYFHYNTNNIYIPDQCFSDCSVKETTVMCNLDKNVTTNTMLHNALCGSFVSICKMMALHTATDFDFS